MFIPLCLVDGLSADANVVAGAVPNDENGGITPFWPATTTKLGNQLAGCWEKVPTLSKAESHLVELG